MGRIALANVIVWLVSSFIASAQTSESPKQPPQRDPTALAVVEKALLAMGGRTSITGLGNSVVTGTIRRGTAADGIVWKTSGSEFRYEVQRGSGTHVLVSGRGNPAFRRNSRTNRIFYHVVRAMAPFHLPASMLVTRADDPGWSVALLGTQIYQGRAVAGIQLADERNSATKRVTTQVWFFDLETGSRYASNTDCRTFWTPAASARKRSSIQDTSQRGAFSFLPN